MRSPATGSPGHAGRPGGARPGRGRPPGRCLSGWRQLPRRQRRRRVPAAASADWPCPPPPPGATAGIDFGRGAAAARTYAGPEMTTAPQTGRRGAVAAPAGIPRAADGPQPDRRLCGGALFAFAVVLGGVTQGYLWHSHGLVLDWLDVAVGVAACAALWWRRAYPVAVFVVVVAAAAFSPLALGAGLVAVGTATSRARGRALVAVVVMSATASVSFPAGQPLGRGDPQGRVPRLLAHGHLVRVGPVPARPARAGRLAPRAGAAAGSRPAAQRRAGPRGGAAAYRPAELGDMGR